VYSSNIDLDGRVVHGPASRPLESYAAVLTGDQVIVTL
jgi:Rieske Fe-S protein